MFTGLSVEVLCRHASVYGIWVYMDREIRKSISSELRDTNVIVVLPPVYGQTDTDRQL